MKFGHSFGTAENHRAVGADKARWSSRSGSRVQFGNPNMRVTSSSFGQITSQANSPRQIKFAPKLLF